MELLDTFGRFSVWRAIHALPSGKMQVVYTLSLTDDPSGSPALLGWDIEHPISLEGAIVLLSRYLAERRAEEAHFQEVNRLVEERNPPEIEQMKQGWAEHRARVESVAKGLNELRDMVIHQRGH